ncbi:MAG TPA: hypothetical protein VHQ03_11670 [Candidatus Dormibacteraeota bacterium]|nr:hypothetical protein [Candidatus Dormibacteraeota bacterium]
MLTQDGVGLIVEPRHVTELHRCRTFQRGEQRVEELHVFLAHRRELEKDRPQLLTKNSDARAEDARQTDPIERFRRVGQAAVGLQAEPKA